MTNPLLNLSKVFPKTRPEDMQDEAWDELLVKRDLAYSIAIQAGGGEAKRLAIAIIQTAVMHQQPVNFNDDGFSSREILNKEECAAHFVPDAFTALLIGLALDGWWNDVIGIACDALGFEITDVWEQELLKFLDANPTFKPLKEQPGYAEAMAARMNGN